MEKQSSPHFCIRSKKSLVKESLYCYHIDKKVHKKAYSQQKGGNSLFWDKSKSSEISLTILPMF